MGSDGLGPASSEIGGKINAAAAAAGATAGDGGGAAAASGPATSGSPWQMWRQTSIGSSARNDMARFAALQQSMATNQQLSWGVMGGSAAGALNTPPHQPADTALNQAADGIVTQERPPSFAFGTNPTKIRTSMDDGWMFQQQHQQGPSDALPPSGAASIGLHRPPAGGGDAPVTFSHWAAGSSPQLLAGGGTRADSASFAQLGSFPQSNLQHQSGAAFAQQGPGLTMQQLQMLHALGGGAAADGLAPLGQIGSPDLGSAHPVSPFAAAAMGGSPFFASTPCNSGGGCMAQQAAGTQQAWLSMQQQQQQIAMQLHQLQQAAQQQQAASMPPLAPPLAPAPMAPQQLLGGQDAGGAFVSQVLALLSASGQGNSYHVLSMFKDLLTSSCAGPGGAAAIAPTAFVGLLQEAAASAAAASGTEGRGSGGGTRYGGSQGGCQQQAQQGGAGQWGRDGRADASTAGGADDAHLFPDGRRPPPVRTPRGSTGGGPDDGGLVAAAAPPTPGGTPLTPARAHELAAARAALLRLMCAAHAMVSSEAFRRVCAAVGPVCDLYDGMHDNPVVVKRRKCRDMAALRDRVMQDPEFIKVGFT
jgi:hypothetical protein